MDEDRGNNNAQLKTSVDPFIQMVKNGLPFDPWHSTPVKKRTSEASIPRSSAKSMHSPCCHPLSFSAMQFTEDEANELENTTIQKQRIELQLVIAELKDRDQELNNMAASHFFQIQAWEQDRQRVLNLEQKCACLENDLQKRNEVICGISKCLKMAEIREKDSHIELSCIQQQLQELSQRQLHISQKHQDLEETNQSLNSTIFKLSSQVGQLQVHEEELNSMLKLKDKDLMEATNQILSLTGHLRDLETSLKASRAHEQKLLRQTEGYKRRFRETSCDNSQLKDELQEKALENNSQKEELIQLNQENLILRKKLSLAGQGESWKDELIALARSKQDRTETELLCLQQVCGNQQNDLQLLKFNLDSTKETLRQCESQMVLERIGNVTGANVLKDSNCKGTLKDQLIGECPSNEIDKDGTSSETEGKERNSRTPASAKPASASPQCSNCDHGPLENSVVDLIAIINSNAGPEESVLLVDFSPKVHCSCSGNKTCVYVDCATSSPPRQLIPGLMEDLAFSTTAKSNQEFSSSTSRLQRLLVELQQMVASLECSSGKPLSRNQSSALSSTPNPSQRPVLNPTSPSYSACSPAETFDNTTSNSHTQSPENSPRQPRMENENDGLLIQKISSSQNLSSGVFDCSDSGLQL